MTRFCVACGHASQGFSQVPAVWWAINGNGYCHAHAVGLPRNTPHWTARQFAPAGGISPGPDTGGDRNGAQIGSYGGGSC